MGFKVGLDEVDSAGLLIVDWISRTTLLQTDTLSAHAKIANAEFVQTDELQQK